MHPVSRITIFGMEQYRSSAFCLKHIRIAHAQQPNRQMKIGTAK